MHRCVGVYSLFVRHMYICIYVHTYIHAYMHIICIGVLVFTAYLQLISASRVRSKQNKTKTHRSTTGQMLHLFSSDVV
jgi:hypothetical protein